MASAQPAPVHAGIRECTRVLGADGVFAELLEGFKPRAQQQTMAQAVAETIEDGGVLVCEAGTGTGKTLGYLVPALLARVPVLVSTGTRTLQDQLYERDLPLARRALGVAVRAALLKGRSNYLCLWRLSQSAGAGGLFDAEQAAHLERVREWAEITRTGDIAELEALAEDSPLWGEVTSTAENCLGQQCPRIGDCFVSKARRRALDADLVVVNHHLLLADTALKEEGMGELLPNARAVIVDEAHQLEATASSFFSEGVSSGQLLDALRDALAAYRDEAGDMPDFEPLQRSLRVAVERAVGGLGEPRRIAWRALGREQRACEALQAVQERLVCLREALEELRERGPGLAKACERVLRIEQTMGRFTGAEDDEGLVRWAEVRRRGFTLYLSPLEIGAHFAEQALARARAWVFTSATLSVQGSVEHFAGALGLGAHRALVCESPFDYARQSLCYVPEALPEPGGAEHTAAVVRASLPVLEASGGSAFLLFTSHAALQRAAALLEDRLSYPLLVQGSAPRAALLNRFRDTPGAVLLGTGSFWGGVDVRGEALSCVIIDKLPFAPPDDPLQRARAEALRARGGEPFRAQQLPAAVIALKQGAGRLIRDVTDRGVLVICDPRLYTRGYGRVFLRSLPPMPVTREIARVRAFFAEGGARG